VLAYPNFKLPFILTTDASKVAIAAILSQVQNGVLKSTQSSYSAPDAEMLALVWAKKYFRCYIYDTKFLVRTDHSALTYLRNFADNNSRLMRWSLRLSELDADTLIGHFGNVMNQNSLNRESVLQEQRKDAFCKKQTPQNLLT
jgi:hypothetical protein